MKIKTTLHFDNDIKFDTTNEHNDLGSPVVEEEMIKLVKDMLLGFRENKTVHLDTGTVKLEKKYNEIRKIEIDILN